MLGIHLLNPSEFIFSPQGCPRALEASRVALEPPRFQPCVMGSGWVVFPGEWGQPLPVPSIPWARGQRQGLEGG